ncbi:MAG: helix-turn-helix transcriptional regulator [Gammaproteobacteria bacterium]|jgi:transcriptional regulator with XRE-family HTH domain|nr:helix-turn-helix transcriptional regulator [Gammaproteobacteria bacterium]MBP6053923.1 helix-turn-helix transcriptional regulator [Pseudomonadales bacterium]MBK6583950.1 helix-turn-helix transcriptional regulator [Gammaproteobacteria bacterium]MBK7169339.1 helix-turn-helix transcriptional regulator [Gammaproteobacteria bacterium]MBK7522453.1 helix-turn-helix transcriptional regulator [Gammaproteobacteria bacterium]
MGKRKSRIYSEYATEALRLFGQLLREARKRRGLTLADVATRAGISRSLMQRIEKGEPGCAIGVSFEVAAIVGVPLFEESLADLGARRAQADAIGALLPKAVRKPSGNVHDEF